MINPLKSKESIWNAMKSGVVKIALILVILPVFNAFSSPTVADRMIRGMIKDAANNAPLPGVNVILKGTQRGTTTDVNGKYELSIPDQDAQLVISFVGYLSQTIDVGSNSTLDITLRVDQKVLDEVVVVGYGTQSRRYVTGAVTKVDMKQTENLPNTNITQSLRGRVAGVQFTDSGRPGQGGSILIRGPRSLSGGNDPLIIVDGIMFNASINYLNPNDIESMEVLKDASAAAIYGSRAANGVILVTTKKGTTEKPTIRFNTFYGFSDWSKSVNLLNPERYIEKTLEMRRQLGLDADPAKITSYLAATEVPNYEAGQTVDPWKAISQKGRVSSYDLSVSGKTDKTNYFLSASITNEDGLIFDDRQKRLSVRSNIENQVTPWLTLGLNASFLKRDLSGLEVSPSDAYDISPYGTWYNENGSPTRWVVAEDQNSANPMYNSYFSKNEEIYYNLFTNVYALIDIPFINGLSYRLNYSPNYRADHNYNFTRQDPGRPDNIATASKFNREDFDWVQENILTYTRQLNNDHSFDATLLYGWNHRGVEATTATATQLTSDVLGWNNLGLGGILTNSSSASGQDGVSSMFRVNYRFKNRYLATFTVRRDGSSVFAANNKYATFPSASLAWVASEEGFIKKLDFISMLKVRLSYGAVGNQAINPYQSLSSSDITRYVFGDGGSTSVGVFTNRMANSNLKWETTYTTNAAIDFELFKNRIGGTIEAYNMNTRDLLVQRSLPTMTGFNSVWANLGATNNKGLELTLNTVNIQRGKLEWSSNFIFSANRNKIVHLYRSDTNGDGKEDDDLGNRWFIGKPMNLAFDYVIDGIYQQGENIPSGFKPGFVKLKDLNGDGKMNADDKTIIGQTGQPLYRWGITNNIHYGPFTFSVFLNAMQGWIAGFAQADPNSNFGGNYPARALNQFDNGWWTADNKSNTTPSLGYNNPYQHNYYFSRDFVRVQDVSLFYEVPAKFIQRAKLANLRISISGKNLATLTKWPGTDPESGGGAIGFPMPRTVAFGLNLGF
ncbi:TonB-dependent receptor [Runella sp.]|uniref:SusC/RagA family TonB-linked outer membrane protein n=2 Tax=Runella sp. TaxID=1960881 RepID=UPI0030191FDF